MPRSLRLAALLLALAPGPAFAHARLLHADPRVGATVRTPPTELSLAFSETIDLARSSVALTGPAGPVATGPLAADPRDARTVRAPLRARLAPGRYRVDWSMTSADTHRTDGDFSFKVAP